MARPSLWLQLLLLLVLVGSRSSHAFMPPRPAPHASSPPPRTNNAAAPVASPPPAPTTCGAPLTPPPPQHRPHKDSALDRFLIGLLTNKLAELMEEGSAGGVNKKRPKPRQGPLPGLPFQAFALSTKALLAPPSSSSSPGVVVDPGMYGDAHLLRRSDQIAAALTGLVPPFLSTLFRLTGRSRLACELHALLAPLVSGWLVGPAKRVEGEIERTVVTVEDGVEERRREVWTSSTKIEQCRYFAEAGCRKACVYLCKVPTQHFFAETLGTPLTLTPDFEDGSCVMAFGQTPLPLDEDPVVQATRALGSCCGSVSPAPAAPPAAGQSEETS